MGDQEGAAQGTPVRIGPGDFRNLFIDRSKGSDALESIKRGVGQLPDGTSILIFPEGTRSWDGKLLPFKKGGFVIAQDGQLPILPITICGSHQRLPKGSAAFSSGEIEIVIHPPMASGALPLDDLMTDVRNSIALPFKTKTRRSGRFRFSEPPVLPGENGLIETHGAVPGAVGGFFVIANRHTELLGDLVGSGVGK